MLREWAADGFANHLLVLDRDNTAPRVDGVRYQSIPAYDYRYTAADALRLQELCDREQADVFVSTYYTTPVTTPSVFVAYDMIPTGKLSPLQEDEAGYYATAEVERIDGYLKLATVSWSKDPG